MRILKFSIACAVLLSSTMVRAQDGVCTVPFDATSLADFIVDEVGLPEAVDFGIAAPLMATSPVADGTIGDGEYSNKCFFTFAENQNPGQSWPTLDNLNDGDADLTANIYFAHTEDNLFVAFEVFDDFLDQDFPANSFQNDGVELFFNPDLDTGDAWGPGKFQIYADAAGDGDIFSNNRGATAGIAPFSDPDPAPGEYYSAGLNLPGDIGYVVEFQIPLASLDKSGGDEIEPIPVETGDFVLINAAIDDNDENDDLAGQTGHHVLWHFEGAGSPWGGGEDIWAVPLALTPEAQVALPGDVNASGALDLGDIEEMSSAVSGGQTGAKYDLNGDGSVTVDDRSYLIEDLFNTYFGDSNLDGEFNSSDFVAVFTAGEYEDATAGNSTWAEGDWNGDGDFDSSDFVAAFTAGGYEIGPRTGVSAVPEPNSLAMISLGAFAILSGYRRRR